MKPVIEEIIREHIIALKEAMNSGRLKSPDDYQRIARFFGIVLTECGHEERKAKEMAKYWAGVEQHMKEVREEVEREKAT